MSKPHIALIHVDVRMYPVGTIGELMANDNVPKKQLRKDGVVNKLLKIQASSYEECIKLVQEKLEEIQ